MTPVSIHLLKEATAVWLQQGKGSPANRTALDPLPADAGLFPPVAFPVALK
jgi:hypothetical protein